MKRKLVASLAAAMVLGIAGTSFAATNPFTDVPAQHWAYASVQSLSQAGLVDGYGDATFKGDKTMTRYEMAQIVAKAMAHSDKADAKQKAVISKLAIEFASELEGLNVRVGMLEKNQPNFKINGTGDMRFSNKDFETSANGNKGTSADYRFRLDGSAKVDDKTTIGVRLVNNSPEQNAATSLGLGQNKSWTKFGNDGGKSTVDVSADRFFINTKIGTVGTTLGRQQLTVGNTGAIVDPGIATFDGLKLKTKMGNVNAALSYGRLPGYADASTAATNQRDIQVAELGTSFGKLSGNVGYFGIKNNAATANTVTLNGIATNEPLKLVYGNAKYQFNSKFSINTELGQNKANYATSNNKFYDVFATLGDQTLTTAKQHNIQARYYYAEKNALGLDGTGSGLNTFNEGVKFGPDGTTFTSDSIKAASVLYNYAFSNNLTGQVGYYVGKSSNYPDGNYKMLRTVLSAKF